MAMSPILVWLQNDLRLADNPALYMASQTGRPLILVFILDEMVRPLGGASRWWLHHSLEALQQDLKQHGMPLILRRGATLPVLQQLLETSKATALYYNQQAETPSLLSLKSWADEQGIEVKSFSGNLLCAPGAISNKSEVPYRVFTAFWKALVAHGIPTKPLPAPIRYFSFPELIPSDDLVDWKLLPTSPNWAAGFSIWQPGEHGAYRRLQAFLQTGLADYHNLRDYPEFDATSRLSPHIRWGEISPRQIWHATLTYAVAHGLPYELLDSGDSGVEVFLRELGWREFSYNLLHYFPELSRKPMQSAFTKFLWRESPEDLQRWQQGQTGYPIVDAGMRQLWQTGWMHNRVRMIVGSFLVKDLQLPWQAGEEWFWDTLVDADPASNAANWQWVAGCGVDAAPYFRIFNPVLQGQKFDAEGRYVRAWLPELKRVPDRYIHAPWEAPAKALRIAGVDLGDTYPTPIVDHTKARAIALNLYARIK